MDKITVIYGRLGNTLDVWWGDPADEEIAEETGEEIILKKDKKGHVIGFEKLNYLNPKQAAEEHNISRLPVEVVLT